MKALLACCLFCLATIAAAQEFSSTPVLSGYVTRVVSASDFDIDGWRVVCGPETRTSFYSEDRSGQVHRLGCPQSPPRIGLAVAIWGTREEKTQTLSATGLAFAPVPLEELTSYGIVEAILARTPESLTVRADGYTIRIPTSAHLDFNAPLHSLTDVTTNVWLDYRGRQQADGTILADDAGFTPNRTNPKAKKTRRRTDYDPTQVTKHGNTAAELLIGVNAMKIPTWPDAAMQARITAIGEKLIPAYQRELPDGDGTKIHFRFCVTAGDPHLRGVLPLPSGIILVPHQAVDRMENDAQLAALLAESIAVEMEAQDARMLRGIRPTRKKIAEETAVGAGDVFVPGVLTLAVGGGSAAWLVSAKKTERQEQQQSARVSLSLMHEAGYDVTEAPVAWWRLAEKDSKPLAETPLPGQSVNLYRDLSTTWKIAPTAPAPGSEESAGK